MFRRVNRILQLHGVQRFYSSGSSDLQGTLHLKFLNHLKQENPIKSNPSLLKTIQGLSGEAGNEASDTLKRFKHIDIECVKSIRLSNNDGIFGVIDALIGAVPGRVATMRVFPEAVRVLLNRFDSNPNTEDFVKLCFYLGLFKKKPPGPILLSTLIEDYLDSVINNVGTIDFSIICTAIYKASVKIKSKKFQQRLIKEVVDTEKTDEFIFVTFIKSLRQNRINSPKVLDKLRNLRSNGELDRLPLISLTHVFTLIADNFIKDDSLAEFFIEKCMDAIEADTRAKDVQKLLYSCALLNYPIKQEHLKKLEQQVMARTSHKEYLQKFDNFVDAALSLWMLNYRPLELTGKLLKDLRFKATDDKSRIKIESRKKLLMTCIEIEEPTLIQHMNIQSPSFNEERQSPRYLIRPSIEKHLKELKGRNYAIVQQIMHLNIAGILIQEANGSLQHIEVLDKTNSLSDGASPNGIFALKLRLLTHLNCKVKLVSYRCKYINSILVHQGISFIDKFDITSILIPRGPSHNVQ